MYVYIAHVCRIVLTWFVSKYIRKVLVYLQLKKFQFLEETNNDLILKQVKFFY